MTSTHHSSIEEVARRKPQPARPRSYVPAPEARSVNVGKGERWASLAGGTMLTLWGLRRRSIPGLLLAGVGGMLTYRGTSGHCPAYANLGIDTAEAREAREAYLRHGIRAAQACTIDKSPGDLYAWCRDLGNLPRIMDHIETVHVIDEKRSHWVATAPDIVGGRVEWDVEITDDQPGAWFAWRSMADAPIRTAGSIRFIPRPEHGTIVKVDMDYATPAGQMAAWAARLFGMEPNQHLREDLRRLKQVMETGEVPTIKGQPHGACQASQQGGR